jgi:DNA-binding NarL/FixJ family response regulator
MSKQRPSTSPSGIGPRGEVDENKAIAHWLRRIFKNTCTRAGQSIRLEGWSVKIQHQGRRRTFSLSAKRKSAAAVEAKAIYDAIVAEGWAAALRSHAGPAKRAGTFPKTDACYWKERLVHRRYLFPASGQTDEDLAVRVDHAGIGYFFPLGTPNPQTGAAMACRIYSLAIERGWPAVCRNFSRELIVGLEWCADPVLWTYTTIHTLVGRSQRDPNGPARGKPGARPVLVVEPDAGVRRALLWCVERHGGFCGVTCESVAKSFARALDGYQPSLVLLNRNLAGRLSCPAPGQQAPIRPGVPALTYSVCADGDQLFVSTPGGAQGYFLKRVQPDRLLEPVLELAARPTLAAEELLSRVKSYFKGLLRPRTDDDASGLAKLTRRERDVLLLLSKGCVDKEIAQTLGISAWTVHGHIKSIFERLRVRTRTEAVVRFLEK